MLGSEIKFQCEQCKGIVATEFDDPQVVCGHCDAVCMVPQKLGPGIVVDDFVLVQLLGQGGMGDVFLAYQLTLDRTVALKILKAKFLEDPKFKGEFIQEARSVASLNHPNIIQAYKVGDENGLLFFAMEYVEGRNLHDILAEQGALDQEFVINIAIDVARALGYAWEHSRLVHRDIKPDNIMVTSDGSAKVMDLGLSKKGEDTVDDSDVVSGTPQYISPEQIVGKEMDVRGDFYSLGATMYHLLSGQFVFDGNLESMIQKHIQVAPVPIKKINPSVNPELSKIVSKLLQKQPKDRYANGSELESALMKARKKITGTQRLKKKRISVKSLPPIGKVEKLKPSTTTGNIKKRARRKKKDPLVPLFIGLGAVLLLGVILAIYLSSKN
jgi:serine/threonine protein kinase